MITILNISDTKFSYNGIAYFKNFTPFVIGNKVSIVNTYDACISLTNFPTIYSDISVDGVTYGSVAALQNALLPVLFNRTFTQAGSLTVGYIPKATGINTLGNSSIYDNGTNVGIGTTSPSALLDINGTSTVQQNLSIANDRQFTLYSDGTRMILNSVKNVPLAIYTNDTERMRITSGGNVGIGTTSPLTALTVSGNLSLFTTNQIRLYNSAKNNWTEIASPLLGGDSEVDFRILTKTGTFYINSGGNVGIGTTSPNSYGTGYVGLTLDGSTTSFITARANGVNKITLSANGGGGTPVLQANDPTTDFAFQVGTTERMRITSTGNVGIGTTSPDRKLTVNSDLPIRLEASSNSSGYYTLLGTNYDYDKSFLINNKGDEIFTYTQNETLGLSLSNPRAGNIRFSTNGSERMRITSGGDVLVGKTSTNFVTVGSQFESNGKTFGVTKDIAGENIFLNRIGSSTGNFMNFLYNSGSVGTISTNGTTTSYNITSDYRVKEDFKSINGLDLISKIKIYDFKFKNSDFRMGGVIAHELQEVVPYAVTGEKDAEQMQSVDYSKLVPILVQAIQELKTEINTLKN